MRKGTEKEGNKEVFMDLLKLAGAIEEIAQRIGKHNRQDLLLHLDIEGRLQIKGTKDNVEIFDLDSENVVVEDNSLSLNYWDVLRSRLKGRKDTIIEIIPKGLELTDIRKLLLHVLLRRELISQDEALTKKNLVNLEGIASRIQNRMKICISSKHLVDNVVKTGENRFGYNQNSSGIKYLLDRIGSGFRVEIINESGVSDSELQTLVSLIFGLGQNFSTKNIAVINQQDATALDYRDSILLLHGDSAGALKSLKDKGVKVLIGEKGVSINVLVTVGIYKLLGKTEDEMEKLLLGLGYTEKQISEMDLRDLINLPPIPSLLPLINDMASMRRMIDISA